MDRETQERRHEKDEDMREEHTCRERIKSMLSAPHIRVNTRGSSYLLSLRDAEQRGKRQRDRDRDQIGRES